MKTNKHHLSYLFVFSIVLLYACNNPIPRKNEITKIEIATGGCFGPCQSTVVNIDSTLVYRYFGGETFFPLPPDANKDKLHGYYLGKISQGFWDTLNIKLEKIKYKQLDTVYQNSVDDQSLELFIHYDHKIKHIKAQSASLPDSVHNVFYFLINSFKTVRPKQTKDTFHFESNLHPSPPMPDVRKVKFLPPK